jgi:GH15 family glucan-1,4-alpha-glucosidase
VQAAPVSPEQPPIEDYAIVGDCRAAALVSRAGSIEWLCWPRFDSPPLLGALLDRGAGRFALSPALPFRSERRYLQDSNVLETRFETASGSATVTDLMPVASEEEKRGLLLPDHELLRVARCERGEVELEVLLEVRPDFGRGRARLRDAGKLGIRIETPEGLLVLRSEIPVAIAEGDRVRGRARLRAGESATLSLTFADEWPAVLPPLGRFSEESVARSVAWWRRWAARLTYSGPEREAVVRSALALRLLVYAPSGALVAAPTTSLPERIGGDLNWDYRFCWIRDASLTVRALVGLGYPEEAEAFLSWLLHSTRLTRPELRILYDVHGKRPPPERIVPRVSGHRGSRPVRIGNAAAEQLQLDVYGEVIDAVTHFIGRGGALDAETRRMLVSWGEHVCRSWRLPDEGIWEPRSGRAHNTHSRVLCWTALDRLLDLHAGGHLRGAPAEAFARNRELIREEVERRAWRPALRSYSSRLDGEELDASLLLLAWYGFAEASSERMRLTFERIRERLGAGDALLYRYRTGESPGEGAFGICSFWGAEFLALGGGTVEEALAAFRRLCRYANDVGLFAEEIDPATGAAIGNFPQAFTHVGLINAALSIQRRLEGRKPLRRADAARPAEAHA